MPYRIADRKEARDVDRIAYEFYSLTELELMENAGRASAHLAQQMAPSGAVLILCGTGNNGGDGFVAARYLAMDGREVHVAALDMRATGKPRSKDAEANLRMLEGIGGGRLAVTEVSDPKGLEDAFAKAGEPALVIDALVGTGFHGEPQGLVKEAIDAINRAGRPVLAIDMPSGCPADGGPVPGSAVRADATITFASPKAGNFSEPGAGLTGRLYVAPIGVPDGALEHITGELIDIGLAGSYLPRRGRDAHKGDLGRVGIVAGSITMPGAAVLSAKGALRGGSGTVELFVPEEAYLPILGWGLLPECMIRPLPSSGGSFAGQLPDDAAEALLSKDAVAFGPGIGRGPGAGAMFEAVMKLGLKKLVLDADALWFAAGRPDLLQARRGGTMLTPHEGEMARLMPAPQGASRVARAKECAAAFDSVVALKGPGTVVARPGGRYGIVNAGNPLMATPGSGDVLTGLAVSVWGRSESAYEALAAAAFLHSLAGDIAAATGAASILAGEIADRIPEAMAMALRAGETGARPEDAEYYEIRRAV
ncbi:MAG TPA: NAD(P)H-hydrate dehydratase [Bacillota bacterium]|nr:NAD(P)H-hydrate dehydratase [Bacillota bacterium]HOG53078.1 NAD(P)H-hydrate dehydratase [Bacillota bacterium]